MKRVRANVQMQQTLRPDPQIGFAGHSLLQFVRRAAELPLRIGLEEQLEAFLGRGPYERSEAAGRGYRNGYGERTVKTDAGLLSLRSPQVRQTTAPFAVQLPKDLRA